VGACGSTLAKPISGEPIAVALDPKGRVYVQSREPAALLLDNGVSVSLSKVSRADTGLALFYMNAGGDVACASCHPEGEDDGLSWAATTGMHRTQSLAGGFSARAPFQWTGEFASLDKLIDTVFVQRMAAQRRPTDAQIETLAAWLEQLPAPQVAEDLDAAAVERGRAHFFDAEGGCGDCHGGPDFSDHLAHDVGTAGPFKTPSLLGVSARAPYFHDACAPDLRAVFGACGGKDHGRELSAAEKADLVEFLRSL
jgi:mono/diheme cytochrome c family protein